jgi:putative transferase (TIGR04331 family)
MALASPRNKPSGSVFLATTALAEFWDADAPMLFLGQWCLDPDRAAERAQLRDEVLPSAWTDGRRLSCAARYLEDAGEILLGRLADYLNTVHGTSYGRRYWRVVLGYWLDNYLHIAYDRYIHLADALARNPDLRTIVLDPVCFQVPNDTRELIYGLKTDERWNLQLVSQLLVAMGHAFESRQAPSRRAHDRPRGGLGRHVARGMLRTLERVCSSLRAGGPDAVLSHMDLMDNAHMWRLSLTSLFRIVPMGARPRVDPVPATFDGRRTGLGSLGADDQFQRAAIACLPHFLPTVFLEGYAPARQRALAGRRIPRVIVSATGWNIDEQCKLFAAEAVERGSRLVAVQHGGNYGYARESPTEVFERRLSDAFITWGWADGSSPALRNLPNPKLSQFRARRQKREVAGRGALFVSTFQKRYVARLHSGPFGTLSGEYFDGQLRFLGALAHDTRRHIRFRPYPGFVHPLRRVIADKFGDVEWDEGSMLHDSLASSRMAVIDNPQTSMLEALAADIPTVLFWNPRHWEMRPEAHPYFDGLRSVGVLHDSPEAAATHFTSVVEDVEAWWHGSAVQKARGAFVHRFALTARDWPAAWLAAIASEVAAVLARDRAR